MPEKKPRVWKKNQLGQYVTAGIPGYVVYHRDGWWYHNGPELWPAATGAYDTREQAQDRAIELHVKR